MSGPVTHHLYAISGVKETVICLDEAVLQTRTHTERERNKHKEEETKQQKKQKTPDITYFSSLLSNNDPDNWKSFTSRFSLTSWTGNQVITCSPDVMFFRKENSLFLATYPESKWTLTGSKSGLLSQSSTSSTTSHYLFSQVFFYPCSTGPLCLSVKPLSNQQNSPDSKCPIINDWLAVEVIITRSRSIVHETPAFRQHAREPWARF